MIRWSLFFHQKPSAKTLSWLHLSSRCTLRFHLLHLLRSRHNLSIKHRLTLARSVELIEHRWFLFFQCFLKYIDNLNRTLRKFYQWVCDRFEQLASCFWPWSILLIYSEFSSHLWYTWFHLWIPLDSEIDTFEIQREWVYLQISDYKLGILSKLHQWTYSLNKDIFILFTDIICCFSF